jgi:hypothetical protein
VSKRPKWLHFFFGVCLMGGPLITGARAEAPWGWWPDPSVNRGLSVWVAYSNDYGAIWSDQSSVDQEVNAMSMQGVQVAFIALSSAASKPHLQTLSNRNDPFTANVQYLIDQLAANNISACASILSDNFTGSPAQMASYVLLDHLMDFNNSLGSGDTGFNCVSTDLEMAAGSQKTTVYDLWKQFHRNLRTRISIDGGGLQLMAWIQGPDFLIGKMDPADRQQLMTREGITQNAADSSLYDGAFQYFTTQGGAAIFDAIIPMWYFTPTDPYYARLDHSVRELKSMGIPDLYLMAGLMVQNGTDGVCCSGCVAGRTDYDNRMSYNDSVRMQFPSYIGTGVFLWPIKASWTCP